MKLLTPFHYTANNPKYRFLLNEDVAIDSGIDLGGHSFCDSNGRIWCEMSGTTWKVKKGYAWDGCSPKFRVFGSWVGTPDFEASRLASLIHDTAYQFLSNSCFPLSRHECDDLFGRIINRDGNRSVSAFTYSGAVWIFGGAHKFLSGFFSSKRTPFCLFHDK